MAGTEAIYQRRFKTFFLDGKGRGINNARRAPPPHLEGEEKDDERTWCQNGVACICLGVRNRPVIVVYAVARKIGWLFCERLKRKRVGEDHGRSCSGPGHITCPDLFCRLNPPLRPLHFILERTGCSWDLLLCRIYNWQWLK